MYIKAVRLLAEEGDRGAYLMYGSVSFASSAFINATINYNRTVLEKLNTSYPSVDLIDLADRVVRRVAVLCMEG